MKRKIVFILLALALVTAISAQEHERERGERQFRFRRPTVETVTVSGAMVVANGLPAVKSGDITYFVTGITRLAGFIDGLKEGAQVTIEGSAFTHPRDEKFKFVLTSKLTIGGRSYDLSPLEWSQGNMGQWHNWQPQRPQMRPPHAPGQRWR